MQKKSDMTVLLQARLGSKRFPNKIIQDLDGISVLDLCITRIKFSKKINKIVLTTTLDFPNNLEVNLKKKYDIEVFRGNENNVLERFYQASKKFPSKNFIRITADCPLFDAQLLDSAIEFYLKNKLNYLSNQFPFQYPDGLDFDIFSTSLLRITFKSATLNFDKEHVTPFMKNSTYTKTLPMPTSGENYSNLRWTLDQKDDLIVLRNIYREFAPRKNFSWKEILELNLNRPELFKANQHIKMNEGAKLSTGEKIYIRAKKIIPGGNMLLSKKPERFLKSGWPSYFSHAKGINIWDLDGNQFKDMSIMGIGTNVLGYANEYVDSAVIEAIKGSNMSTFNAPEEVYLAEKLLELHPWFDQVKFARTGAEINSVAVRVGRIASAKSKIAICGYHGWHDWYLAANLSNSENLDHLLLPGLEVAGVPKELRGSVVPLRFNNFEDLNLLKNSADIGVLIMEVMRSEYPNPGYLENIRQICDEKNITLVFDECTSGFRETYGGLHIKFSVKPDMSTFGKALGNGFAITALLGNEKVMQHASKSFISSTFWSERVGYVAALATLEEMQNTESWMAITDLGRQMQKIWLETFQELEIPIKVTGIPALSAFVLPFKNGNKLKTYITKRFLQEKILASNIFYPSIAHQASDISEYNKILKQILKDATKFRNRNSEFDLDIEEAETGFNRLN